MNRKRVQRIYREERLTVRKRSGRKRALRLRVPIEPDSSAFWTKSGGHINEEQLRCAFDQNCAPGKEEFSPRHVEVSFELLELWMKMRLWFLDDQAAKGSIRVLRQLAQHHGHKNQVVVAKAVSLDLKRIHQQRDPSRKLLEIACAQSYFDQLSELLPEHRFVPPGDGGLRIDNGLMLFELGVEVFESGGYRLLSRII